MGIKIEDIAFVGFRAPDLATMRMFMEDFGAVVAHRDETHLDTVADLMGAQWGPAMPADF